MYAFSIEDLTDEELEIAKNNGIPRSVVKSRLEELYWDIDDAITKPIQKRKSFNPIWDKWKDKAVVSRQLMYDRVMIRKMDEDEAALTPKMPNRKSKVWTDEEVKIMKENGIYQNLALGRLALGWSKEDAITKPIMGTEQRLERVREGVENRDKRKWRENNELDRVE